MNEKPKTVWNRPWEGRGRLAGWSVILLAVGLFAYAALRLVADPQMSTGKILFGSLLLTLVALLAVVLAIFFIRWLCYWRNLRRFLFGLACLATLIAVFYLVENVRGKLAWNAYVREVEAQGESLDLADFIPPPVPDDQNLMLCPLLKPITDMEVLPEGTTSPEGSSVNWHDPDGRQALERFAPEWSVEGYARTLRGAAAQVYTDPPEFQEVTNGWINLKGWESFYLFGTNLHGLNTNIGPAQNVLNALRYLDTDIALLKQEAALRPLDRWPIYYNTNDPFATLLPHLAEIKRFTQLLQLRASANLAAGRTEEALSDFELGRRFADSVCDEPFLVSALVRFRCHQLLMQPLQEGLARHQFTENQLVQLLDQLAKTDMLGAGAMVGRGDRSAFGGTFGDSCRRNRNYRVNMFESEGLELVLMWAAPRGWVYQNQLTLCRLQDEYLLGPIDVAARRVHPEIVYAADDVLEQLKPPFGVLARVMLPAVSRVVMRVAEGQTLMDQAVIACTLERHYLANGRYPEKLEELSPAYLEDVPYDVFTGEAMIYRLLPDGRYILYSVGWNEQDDGGKAPAGPRASYDPDAGEDWVWELPDLRLQPY